MPSRELQQLQQLQRVKAFAGAKVKYRDKAAMVIFPRACRVCVVSLPLREYAPAISHHGGRVTWQGYR
ncbi:MAG: hypothetical protein J6Y41_06350 [Bacteroidaceae bacterium]|nr:hypothetical protein [Bacteroidaceae bacterium]